MVAVFAGESGGSAVHAADIGSKTKQAQSSQKSDVNVREEASAAVGSYLQLQQQQQKGTRSQSTGQRQDSIVTRRQSGLWERTGSRLQRADTTSLSKGS